MQGFPSFICFKKIKKKKKTKNLPLHKFLTVSQCPLVVLHLRSKHPLETQLRLFEVGVSLQAPLIVLQTRLIQASDTQLVVRLVGVCTQLALEILQTRLIQASDMHV